MPITLTRAARGLMSNPQVSVIIPSFNLGRFLPEAIASVRRQTFPDFEIVVVDDGSTDPETAEAIRSAAGPDLRAVRSDNRGLSAARNLGISEARGGLISCLDADDIFAPQWLELAVARLDAEPDLAFVSHWLEAFGDEQGEWTPGRGDLAALLDQNVFNGAALFRRQLVDEVGGFDESMRDGCEDWEFWIRVMEAGHRGAILPRALYRYRRRPDSMSRAMTDSDTWFRLFGEIVEKHPNSYREQLLDLLLRREWTIAGLCRGIDAVQEELPTILEPAVRMRRRELEAARARLSDRRAREELAETRGELVQSRGELAQSREELRAVRAYTQTLEEAHRALDRERNRSQERIETLHQSWSWRITSPLRRIYEWLGGGRKR
jgi:glycosyltransferase involved in cell wall biosynthesis